MNMAKKRTRPRAAKRGKTRQTALKVALIGLMLIIIAFFALLQTVRSGLFGDLPSEEQLASIQHEQATLVLDRDGELIGKIFADLQITRKIKDAGQLMEIQVLDHLIITQKSHFSFADNGLL